MRHMSRMRNKARGQAETRPGLLGELARLNYPVPDLFSHWRRRWGHDLLVLRTSPESQSADQNGYDNDHFQKFQSISPPFAASCSGLFRQGTAAKQCFSKVF